MPINAKEADRGTLADHRSRSCAGMQSGPGAGRPLRSARAVRRAGRLDRLAVHRGLRLEPAGGHPTARRRVAPADDHSLRAVVGRQLGSAGRRASRRPRSVRGSAAGPVGLGRRGSADRAHERRRVCRPADVSRGRLAGRGAGPLAASVLQTERALERAGALVLRTHAYGWSPARRSTGFAERLFDDLAAGRTVALGGLRHATPILDTDLAELVARADERRLQGLYHAAGAERTSPWGFATALAAAMGLPRPSVSEDSRAAFDDNPCLDETSLNSRRCAGLAMPTPMLADGLERFVAQAQAGWRDRWQTGGRCARYARAGRVKGGKQRNAHRQSPDRRSASRRHFRPNSSHSRGSARLSATSAAPGEIVPVAMSRGHRHGHGAGRHGRAAAVVAVLQHGHLARRQAKPRRRQQVDLRVGLAVADVVASEDEAKPRRQVEPPQHVGHERRAAAGGDGLGDVRSLRARRATRSARASGPGAGRAGRRRFRRFRPRAVRPWPRAGASRS